MMGYGISWMNMTHLQHMIGSLTETDNTFIMP